MSRGPHTSPAAIAPATAELIIRLRKELSEQGLDAAGHHLLAASSTPSASAEPTPEPNVTVVVHGRDIRIIDAATGELLRGTSRLPGPPPKPQNR